MSEFSAIHQSTLETYQANAHAWDQQRHKGLFEQAWLDRFTACLSERARVLDVGCGTGEPIARYLIEQGLSVSGLDAAPAMVDLCRNRFPGHDWQVMDMRQLSLDHRLDGIVAWDSFFHLNQTEQRAVLALFGQHLNPGGALLTTIGDGDGEVLGKVNGQDVYHASLHPDEYTEILTDVGFANIEIKLWDPDCAEHCVLLASGLQF
ncbi:MAG: class I SAM-dependent methyltransferase [Pseudomonadota bacterium]